MGDSLSHLDDLLGSMEYVNRWCVENVESVECVENDKRSLDLDNHREKKNAHIINNYSKKISHFQFLSSIFHFPVPIPVLAISNENEMCAIWNK